mmetsp:Transcript_5673/g.17676  ORF Transcript_5673/g.17676 Transcript_5673/m.17676 type:complete len:183 (+) Transcript_5673:98-646(+)|eukprot:scaffold134475_cov48-Tisochrysis_lutea.AAC.1
MATRTLFCTASHTWLRLHRSPMQGGLLAVRSAWRAELGLTRRGCDDIGDVVHIQHLATLGWVEAGEQILRLDWEAHSVSTADELYHTTWGILEQEHFIRSPVSATILGLCDPSGTVGTLTPSTTLATLHIDRPALQSCGLVDEKRYLEYVASTGPGMFADSTLHEQHSIGGHEPPARQPTQS